jgi:hypothetical protein
MVVATALMSSSGSQVRSANLAITWERVIFNFDANGLQERITTICVVFGAWYASGPSQAFLRPICLICYKIIGPQPLLGPTRESAVNPMRKPSRKGSKMGSFALRMLIALSMLGAAVPACASLLGDTVVVTEIDPGGDPFHSR